ncbi:hypothetical protein [Methylobacterium trifolii]|uniref:Uncharacterized protein n=1 Tax=Methylobacterium trifolii TaxID=1003092 RepID=A0ABQ4U464_9HYPH|nr:hypothetical protein [Methylobacterium trifolii]GJE61177.1 hypothetical protein MPOCJGCO_3298 [Methylobacterium trifolii]
MHDIATREVATRDLWQAIPLECLVCALAVFLAAGLQLAGLMP